MIVASAEQELLSVPWGTFEFEHSPLGREATGRREPTEGTVGSDDSMAGHDDRVRVPGQRRSDFPCGVWLSHGSGDFAVTPRCAGRNLTRRGVDLTTERVDATFV